MAKNTLNVIYSEMRGTANTMNSNLDSAIARLTGMNSFFQGITWLGEAGPRAKAMLQEATTEFTTFLRAAKEDADNLNISAGIYEESDSAAASSVNVSYDVI